MLALIVDDEPFARRVLKEELELLSIEIAFSGTHFVQLRTVIDSIGFRF
jgi:CheY-like chemotaxis protein